MSNGIPAPSLSVGMCIVELQKLKRKYSEIAKARESLLQSVSKVKPGRYENFSVVNVKEVKVKSHTRKAHTRILLRD